MADALTNVLYRNAVWCWLQSNDCVLYINGTNTKHSESLIKSYPISSYRVACDLLTLWCYTKYCCSRIKLPLVKPLHTCHSYCLYTTNWPLRSVLKSHQSSKMPLRMVRQTLLHHFGTLSLHLSNVPLPLMLSRASFIYSVRHIPRSIDFYSVRVYYSWLFLCFLFTNAFEHDDLFWNKRIIIIIICCLLLLLLYYFYYYHYYYFCY